MLRILNDTPYLAYGVWGYPDFYMSKTVRPITEDPTPMVHRIPEPRISLVSGEFVNVPLGSIWTSAHRTKLGDRDCVHKRLDGVVVPRYRGSSSISAVDDWGIRIMSRKVYPFLYSGPGPELVEELSSAFLTSTRRGPDIGQTISLSYRDSGEKSLSDEEATNSLTYWIAGGSASITVKVVDRMSPRTKLYCPTLVATWVARTHHTMYKRSWIPESEAIAEVSSWGQAVIQLFESIATYIASPGTFGHWVRRDGVTWTAEGEVRYYFDGSSSSLPTHMTRAGLQGWISHPWVEYKTSGKDTRGFEKSIDCFGSGFEADIVFVRPMIQQSGVVITPEWIALLRTDLERALTASCRVMFDRWSEAGGPKGLIAEVEPALYRYALNDLRYMRNSTLLFLRDLTEIKKAVRPIADVLRRPSSIHSWANLWLTYRYGISLMISDLNALIKGYKRFVRDSFRLPVYARSRATARLSSDNSRWEFHLKLASDALPDEGFFDGLIAYLRALDAYPSLYQLWDAIPYSFVLDWFLPVQDLLEQIDHWMDIEVYKLRFSILSARTSLPAPLISLSEFQGSPVAFDVFVQAGFYHRWCAYPKDMPLALSEGSGLTLVHAIDLSALIVQRSPEVMPSNVMDGKLGKRKRSAGSSIRWFDRKTYAYWRPTRWRKLIGRHKKAAQRLSHYRDPNSIRSFGSTKGSRNL